MKKRLEQLTKIPWIAHWLRAFQRFGQRLGSQFAAAITYFSVLSLVPVLMSAFAVLGLTVTVINPGLLVWIKDTVTSQLAADDQVSKTITKIIDDAANSWQAVGIIGLVSALWAGANWVGNLKTAVRVQLRDEFELGEKKAFILIEALKNIGILVGLVLAIVVTFATSSVATALGGLITDWLHLDQVPGGPFLVRVLPVVASLVALYLLFLFLFKVFPERPVEKKAWLVGSIFGAAGTVVLQYLATLLIGVFSNNPAAALFGPVIILMLFFNLFATLVLMVAAWIGTEVDDTTRAAQASGQRASTVGPTSYEAKRVDTNVRQPAQLRAAGAEEPVIKEAVAKRAMKVSAGAGYVTGAATGLGLGAAVASGLAWLMRRR